MDVVQITKSFGARTVLQDVGFRVGPGDRLAVIGRNGEGKTTLLRILAGQLSPDAGTVSLPRGSRVALHDQRPPLHDDGRTLGDYVAEGMAEAMRAEAELAELEARMAAGDTSPQVMGAWERASAVLERAGGYQWRTWMARVTRGLGIPDERLDDPLGVFSGGELTRASLARALVSRPDVLLLDEPTNHLDVDSAEWLEEAVTEMGSAVVLVSHDRWFLESVATGVLELENGRSKLWPMGYSRFRREKAQALETQAREAERTAAEIARLERFVTRWRAGTKAKQAASRQKRLDRIERVDGPRRSRSLEFGFPPVTAAGRVVLEAHGLEVSVAGTTLLRDVDIVIERGQRVALVGPNGAGKTTLVDTLLGIRRPAAGRVSLGHRVEPAHFSQHGVELRDDRTVVDSLLADTGLTRTQARTLLGAFMFPGEAADRRVADLSGGERRRLSLAALVARGGNLLVLDEPTNHLDAESREALEDALLAYEGTLVIITHDRALIDAVATRTLSIEDGRLVAREGGWAELVGARRAAAAAPEEQAPRKAAPAKKPAAKRPPPTQTAERANAQKGSPGKRVRQLETKVARLESELAEVEAALADPANLSDHEKLAELAERHRGLQEDISWALAEWERAAEAAGV